MKDKKLIRLFVMTQIKHPESYYQDALKSADVDIKNLTHNQIAAYKATMKVIEADLIIEMAFSESKTKLSDIDISVFKACTKTF